MLTEGQAYTRAKALCAKLGDGWTPHVFENLGWHWRACKDGWEVYWQYHSRRRLYCASIQDPDMPVAVLWLEHGSTAADAMANVLAKAEQELMPKVCAFLAARRAA